MKRLLIGLLFGCIIGMAGVAYVDTFMNPGRIFFMKCFALSDKWAEQLRSESPAPCYIMAGSSDVRMSIDPAAMKDENGVRAINAGAHAGQGENVNFLLALDMARPGDTIVSFPVATWQPPESNIPGGVKFLVQRCGPGAFEQDIVNLNARHLLYLFRGNTGYTMMYLGKMLRKAPLSYSYDRIATLRESGWVEIHMTMNKWPTCPLAVNRLKVKDVIPHLLIERERCARRGVSFVVQIPRFYSDVSYRAKGAYEALYLVRQGVRVLKDPALGVETDMQLMGDTDLHHNAVGAQAYSRTLARLLAAGEYWTEAELVEELRARGWNEDGTPLENAAAAEK